MNPEQIGLLIEKYALGTITGEELRLLMEWYRNAGQHKVVWPEGRVPVQRRMLARLNKSFHTKPSKVVNISLARAAAVTAIAVGLAVFAFHLAERGSPQFYTVTNTLGKIQLVQLPDSSRVWLNASTTLKYDKSFKDNRRLELDGEAFFDVTKDPEHAFTIKTGEMTTTVVGTSFNVSAWKDDDWKSVSVVSGKVRVSDESKELALLSPSKSLRYDTRSRTATVISADTTYIKSWTRGKLQFNGNPLSEITRTLNRWYGYSFRFNNSKLENCRYYLNLDNSLKIDEVINVLREVAGLQIDIDHTSKSISINGTLCL